MRYIVYALIDPTTLLVRYVGKSTRGGYRAEWHLTESGRKGETHRANWLKQIHQSGLTPIVHVLESASKETLDESEVWWIVYGRMCGWPLTNMTAGGDGGSKGGFHWTARPGGIEKITAVNNRPDVRAQRSRSKTGARNPMKRPEVAAKLKATLAAKTLARPLVHGTRFAYDHRNCRCRECVAFNTRRCREYRAKHRESYNKQCRARLTRKKHV